MSDEVETAEEVAEALYERRVGKVVKLASFAAADMPVDADGMTTEERQLFDDLVDRISENKSRVLDVLAGEAPPASTTTPYRRTTRHRWEMRRTRPVDGRERHRRLGPARAGSRAPAETPSGEDDEAPGPGRAPTRSRAPWAVRTTRWPTPSTPRPMSRLTASHGRPTVRQQTVTQPLTTTRPLATVRHRFRRSPPAGNTGHGRERRPSRERRRSDRRHCRRRRLLRPRHGQDHPRRGGDIRSRRAGVRPRKRGCRDPSRRERGPAGSAGRRGTARLSPSPRSSPALTARATRSPARIADIGTDEH